MLAAAAVIVRIVVNPLSNLFQKQLAERSAEPLFIIAATHAMLTVVAVPLLAAEPVLQLGASFWGNMLTAAVLAVLGNVLLVYALRSADLSVLGPINAYKAVLSLALAALLIGEVPTRLGLAGVALILAGSCYVIDHVPGQSRVHGFARFASEPAVQLRVAALVCSATEAVFLKRALLLSTPLDTFLLWSGLGLPIAALAVATLLRRTIADELIRLRREWRAYLALATATGLMQLTTLLAFETLQVGYALAMFQLSALVSVVLGHQYFNERNIRRRLFGSAIMVAGAALIVARGRAH